VLNHQWNYRVSSPDHAELVAAADGFCSAVLNRETPRWLSALGPSGIGKTFLLQQVFNFLKNEAWNARWKMPTATGQRTPMIAHISPAIHLNDWKSPKDYAGHDLIYLEDIGAGQGLEKGAGAVLRGRIAELLQLRSNKFTLLCANMGREALTEHFDGRIGSRLGRDESVVIEFPEDTPDFQTL
jgi:chromosomal replication initiation ATPase DnaA